MNKSKTLTIRLLPETRAKLDAMIDAHPYHPNITAIVERGIDLALVEMDMMNAAAEEYRVSISRLPKEGDST